MQKNYELALEKQSHKVYELQKMDLPTCSQFSMK